MKSSIRFSAHAVFLVSVVVSTAAYAADPMSAVGRQPEMLPDGNLRDPEPTAEELKNFVSSVKRNMVLLQGGTFEMGDWGPEVNEDGLPFDGTRDSKPLHKVKLSDFYIEKYPVTYVEFDLFTAAKRLPRINQDTYSKSFRKPDNPAAVTWQGAKDYCLWLAELTGQQFDLPTEAQWEYAARSGGKRYLYPTDNGKAEEGRNLPSYEQMEAAGGLVPVSSFPPNPAGIYYMSAGVYEYTNDWYDPYYYKRSPLLNPSGPATGTVRVRRGYAGNVDSAMTFKRWSGDFPRTKETWTLYSNSVSVANREIPYTKYSNLPDSAFRCVLNQGVKFAKIKRTASLMPPR